MDKIGKVKTIGLLFLAVLFISIISLVGSDSLGVGIKKVTYTLLWCINWS